MTSRSLFRILLRICTPLILGVASTVSAACLINPNDGGPYTINEGDGIEFVANPTSSNTGAGTISMGWDIGGACFLGNGTGLVVNRDGANGIQNCLLSTFTDDSGNNSFPGGIEYSINDGTCTLTGSTDLILNNTLPNVSIDSTCSSPLVGTAMVDFSGSDPAQSDYPLNVFLVLDDGSTQTMVDSTTLANPTVTGGTLSFDTTSYPDGTYTLFVEIQDDTGPMLDSIGCTIDNIVSTGSSSSSAGGKSSSITSDDMETDSTQEEPSEETNETQDTSDQEENNTTEDTQEDTVEEETPTQPVDPSNDPLATMLIWGLTPTDSQGPSQTIQTLLESCQTASENYQQSDEESSNLLYTTLCPQGNTMILLGLLSDRLAELSPEQQSMILQRVLIGLDRIPSFTRWRFAIDPTLLTQTLLMGVETPAISPQDKAYNEVIQNADTVLKEFQEHIGSTTDQLCPPELIAKLLTTKAALEAQAATLSETIRSKEKALQTITDTVDQQAQDIKDKEKDLKDQKDKADKKQQDIDDLDSDIKDLDQDIKDEQTAVQKLQDTLTNEDDITEHVGDAPLDDIDSGAAISFDGGASWVVAHGESGVEKLTGKFDGLRSVIDQLQEHQKKIRDLQKQKTEKEDAKKKAQDEKDTMDKKIAKDQKALDDIKKKQDEDKKKQQACRDELTALKAKATQLNAKIEAFNAAAAKCGIKARKAYVGAKQKLDQMPPEEKKAAKDKFEESMTDEEKDAVDNRGDDEETGGTGLAGAAKKLEDAMRGASDCPPPQDKKDGPYRESQSTRTINGADALYVINSKGTRGLADQSQKDIMKDLMTSANATNDLSTIQSRVEFGTSGNPVSLAYGYFQSQATKAIFDKLKQRQREGTLRGLPEWIEVYYGPVWSFDVTRTKRRWDNYACEDGIWQYQHSEYDSTASMTECVYGSDGRYRYTVQDADLNLKGCTAGTCPAAWADAIKIAVRKTLEEKVSGGMIGTCEDAKGGIK